jgi:hypothetical protein
MASDEQESGQPSAGAKGPLGPSGRKLIADNRPLMADC